MGHLGAEILHARTYLLLRFNRRSKSLQAARNIADHLMQELADKHIFIVQKGNHRGMAATSVLEPITQLYVRTHDKRYLQFAEEIVREWESPMGPQLIQKSRYQCE